MSVNLPQLRAFLAVVDTGGFSAAADELGMSQSAVSHAVASLERELAGPLLIRSNPARATVLGERVLPYARTALSAVRSLEAVAADATGALTGTVRLAATPTVCRGLVPRLLRHWRAGQPRVTVRVFEGDSAEVAEWLENGTADAGILIDPPPGPGVQLALDGYRALLPRDHPLAGEAVVDVRDLVDDPYLVSPGGCEARVRELHRLAGLLLSGPRGRGWRPAVRGLAEAAVGV
ncbi:LysR family transcriptional regulator [Streptomyces huasconensis]|uniref:LysR family transcriptional regulator n=1 Tax=Streptomyces huasconensis TaxID=1854574 RepID=UPI0036F5863C